VATGPRFGEVLRRYRLAAGLTQEELAARSQMSPHAISDLERGEDVAFVSLESLQDAALVGATIAQAWRSRRAAGARRGTTWPPCCAIAARSWCWTISLDDETTALLS
jgi:transcriptional regulator with XRE-family HTH domain